MLATQLPRVLNYGQPVNRAAPLNRGRVSWFLSIPQRVGGNRFIDLTGRNSGTITSGAWSGQHGPGRTGSIKLNGTTTVINCGLNDLPTVQGSKTIAFWQNWTTVSSNRASVTLSLTSNAVQVGYRGTSSSIVVWKSGGTVLVTAATAPTAGLWYYVVYSYDGTNHDLDIFGAATVSVTNNTASNSGTPTSFKIGDSGFSEFVDGYIDDVSVWNRYMSSSERRQLYNASRTGYRRELNWLDRPWVLNSAGSVLAMRGNSFSIANNGGRLTGIAALRARSDSESIDAGRMTGTAALRGRSDSTSIDRTRLTGIAAIRAASFSTSFDAGRVTGLAALRARSDSASLDRAAVTGLAAMRGASHGVEYATCRLSGIMPMRGVSVGVAIDRGLLVGNTINIGATGPMHLAADLCYEHIVQASICYEHQVAPLAYAIHEHTTQAEDIYQ